MIHHKVCIIAEAGVNHNGSLELAKQLVDVAKEAGADVVKFQTFKTEHVVSKHAEKAIYQKGTTDIGESQWDMLRKLELNADSHEELFNYCNNLGIEFLSTPFDIESVILLAERLKLKRLKIPSGEITNAPLLLKISQTGLPVILSTGMATLVEIETALGILSFGYINNEKIEPSLAAFQDSYSSKEGLAVLKRKVTLLHCTSEYPTPFPEVNLNAMNTLRKAFNLPVGFSDHTSGNSISIAAVALGACIIEKHFTRDKGLPGPDHKASLGPDELKALIKGIRELELALGDSVKVPSQSERKNMSVIRRSLVTNREIKRGDTFTETNLSVKRPGNGISPMFYWDWLGRKSERNYGKDELVF